MKDNSEVILAKHKKKGHLGTLKNYSIFYLLTILFVGIIILILAELLLRFIPNSISRINIDEEKPKFTVVRDPKTGWFLGANQTIDWPPFTEGNKINSAGNRDVERVKKGSLKRCILLGDSYLRAFEVNLNETFYAKLEKFFNREMINFGVSGHGTTQAYATYINRAREYTSDCVIYFFYINDFTDNNRILRSYSYSKGKTTTPYLQAPEIHPHLQIKDKVLYSQASWPAEKNSFKVKNFLKQNFHSIRAAAYFRRELINFHDLNQNHKKRKKYLIDTTFNEDTLSLAFWQMEKSLQLLKNAVESDKKKFIVVYLPYILEYLTVHEQELISTKNEIEPQLFEKIKSHLVKTIQHLKISFLDPVVFFNQYKITQKLIEPYFIFKNNTHFNIQGHNALYEFLKKEFVFFRDR